MSRLLVTGATGFVGRAVVDELARASHDLVGVWHTREPALSLNAIAAVDWIHASKAACWLDAHPVDGIVHIATDYGNGSVSALVQGNVAFPIRLLESAIANGCRLFVNTDTFFAKSEFDYRHMSEYIESKKQLVGWCHVVVARTNGLRVVNMRLEHVFGPHDNSGKFFPQLVDRLRSGEEVRLTPGNQKRDFVFVEDVASAFRCVAENVDALPAGFTELQVGTGRSIELDAFVRLTRSLLESQAPLSFGALPHRSGEIMDSKADIGPLSALGWKVQHSLVQALRKSIGATGG